MYSLIKLQPLEILNPNIHIYVIYLLISLIGVILLLWPYLQCKTEKDSYDDYSPTFAAIVIYVLLFALSLPVLTESTRITIPRHNTPVVAKFNGAHMFMQKSSNKYGHLVGEFELEDKSKVYITVADGVTIPQHVTLYYNER